MDLSTVAANQEQQRRLYGAPLGELVRHLTATLGISQARVAETLGLSAPMLSQLASGQRIKISNPQAVARLQALLELAATAPRLSAEAISAQLAAIAARNDTVATPATRPAAQTPVAWLATLDDPTALLAAAAAAAPCSPPVAAALRQAAQLGTARG